MAHGLRSRCHRSRDFASEGNTMSKRNILVAFGLSAALLCAPAYADGKAKKTVFNAPTPLKAQPYCESGKGYYDDAGRFICPVVTRKIIRKQRPVVTRITAPAPAKQLDLTGFNGGVGSTIGTGYVGGGRGYIVTNRASYSGVLSHAAAAYTFSHRGGNGGGHGGYHCGC